VWHRKLLDSPVVDNPIALAPLADTTRQLVTISISSPIREAYECWSRKRCRILVTIVEFET
jgi:hypothetical protein